MKDPDYSYIMAFKGSKKAFIRFHNSRHEELIDKLNDEGYTKIGQCAQWYYWAQLEPNHSERIPGAIVKELDEDDDIDVL